MPKWILTRSHEIYFQLIPELVTEILQNKKRNFCWVSNNFNGKIPSSVIQLCCLSVETHFHRNLQRRQIITQSVSSTNTCSLIRNLIWDLLLERLTQTLTHHHDDANFLLKNYKTAFNKSILRWNTVGCSYGISFRHATVFFEFRNVQYSGCMVYIFFEVVVLYFFTKCTL